MSSSDNHLVLRNDHDGISTLAFNRPDALNALSPSLFAELEAHLDDLAKSQEEIGVIVLTGRGRSFSAGNDLKAACNRFRQGSLLHGRFGTCDCV